ncbi:hypothetical protein X975_13146, partial [Stegodyphus mimosarum]
LFLKRQFNRSLPGFTSHFLLMKYDSRVRRKTQIRAVSRYW